jgi:lipoyl(octanoyl) transferase
MQIPLLIKSYDQTMDYMPIWQAMQAYTKTRDPQTPDQIWILEHKPVYTLGLAACRSHLIQTKDIPVIQADRGGQVTYHGPGQWMFYTLLDTKRLGLNTAQMVHALEQAVIQTLGKLGILATGNPQARGVYVNHEKIAALGLKFTTKGCYHGLALNVDMNIDPFLGINPCGYAKQSVTSIQKQQITFDQSLLKKDLIACFLEQLGAKFNIQHEDINDASQS